MTLLLDTPLTGPGHGRGHGGGDCGGGGCGGGSGDGPFVADGDAVVLVDAVRVACGALSGLDVCAMTHGAVRRSLQSLTEAENALGAAKAALVHRLAESGSWAREGYRSPAQQLARAAGITEGEAKKQLGVAKAAAENPALAAAMAEGDVSGSQAEILAPVFEHAPDDASELLGSTKVKDNQDLKRRAHQAVAAATESQGRERAAWRARGVELYQDPTTGVARMVASGPAGIVNALMARIEKQAADVARTHNAAEHGHRRMSQRRFDALVSLLGAGALLVPPDRDEPAPPDATLNPQAGNVTTKLIYHLDLTPWHTHTETSNDGERASAGSSASATSAVNADVANGDTCSDETHPTGEGQDVAAGAGACSCGVAVTSASLQGVGPVPVSFVEALAANPHLERIVKLVLKDGRDPKLIATYTRSYPDDLRVALRIVDGACSVPHCAGQGVSHLDHDPVRFEHGAPASLFTADHKCTAHHNKCTHDGHLLLGERGNRVYIDAEGNVLAADRSDHPPVTELLEQRQAKINHINEHLARPPDTPTPGPEPPP